MKRNFLTGLSVALTLCATLSLFALTQAEAAQREAAPPLGRYNCTPLADGPAFPGINLISKDRYESADNNGIYVYETSSGRIEWLTGSISRRLVGFYTPRGVDNAAQDTIIIRDKKDVEEGKTRDLWRCNPAG